MRINGNILYDFEGIRIYKDGEVLFKSDRGYIEQKEFKGEKIETIYNGRITNFNLKKEIKRANKLNLNRKDNFYIVEKIPYHYPPRASVLYIHADEINVESLGDKKAFITEDETNYIDTYKLTFNSGFNYAEMDYREVPEGYKFANNDEKNNYVEVERGVNAGKKFIREYKEIVANECLVTGDYYTRTEISDFRQAAKELEEEFKKVLPHSNMSFYDIERLMKVYNITKKEDQ